MYVIRLMRLGTKKKPTFRVVAICNKKARGGMAKQYLGYYLPVSQFNKKESFFIKDFNQLKSLKINGVKVSMRINFLLKKYYNFYFDVF